MQQDYASPVVADGKMYFTRRLGEVYVFVFFGLMATLGTLYTQAHELTVVGVLGAVAAGAL